MDIGNKLQRARTNANLTQEQVAEKLGISRQTLSNWENEKTYPDIISVVTLSDLYHVSLDYLLKDKEENTMTNYLDYLEESTNTVKSRIKWAEFLVVAIYLAIWALAAIVFWFFTGPSDAFGFGLVYMMILIPVTTFVLSLLIGKNKYYGKFRWGAPLAFGIMYTLADYATFSAANMFCNEYASFYLPDWELIIQGTIISAIGLGIGTLLALKKKTK